MIHEQCRPSVGTPLAQDLVQDASAAYLVSPPREEGASKAWLAQVVRRAAGKLHRSGARLRERESAVARSEFEPSGIEVLDRQLDTQSVLIDLVKELPSPQPSSSATTATWHPRPSPSSRGSRSRRSTRGCSGPSPPCARRWIAALAAIEVHGSRLCSARCQARVSPRLRLSPPLPWDRRRGPSDPWQAPPQRPKGSKETGSYP